MSAGSIDVYKCFDQLNRKLIYKLAKEAGMPRQILETYFQYIDNVDVRFQIGKHSVKPTVMYHPFPKDALFL